MQTTIPAAHSATEILNWMLQARRHQRLEEAVQLAGRNNQSIPPDIHPASAQGYGDLERRAVACHLAGNLFGCRSALILLMQNLTCGVSGRPTAWQVEYAAQLRPFVGTWDQKTNFIDVTQMRRAS